MIDLNMVNLLKIKRSMMFIGFILYALYQFLSLQMEIKHYVITLEFILFVGKRNFKLTCVSYLILWKVR